MHRPLSLVRLTQPQIQFLSFNPPLFQPKYCSSHFHFIDLDFLDSDNPSLSTPTMSRTKEKEKDKHAHSKLIKPLRSCNLNVATDEPKAVKKGIYYIAQVHNKDPKERKKEPVVAQILRALKIKHSAKKGPWSGANVKDNQSDLKVNTTKPDKVFRKTETLNNKATKELSFELVEKEEEMQEPEPVFKVGGMWH